MAEKDADLAGQIRLIGCCGAYCRTCPPFRTGYCKGCKLGYEAGQRDIKNAKCKMKVCCFGTRTLETCADCSGYLGCEIILGFHAKNGFKYRKYKQSIEFIRENGYAEFLRMASDWRCAYGRLEALPDEAVRPRPSLPARPQQKRRRRGSASSKSRASPRS